MSQESPYGRHRQAPRQPPYGGYPQDPDGRQRPYASEPQSPSAPQQEPPYASRPEPAQAPPPKQNKPHWVRNTLLTLGGLVVLTIAVAAASNAGNKTVPGPTVTMTVTATMPGPTVTVSVTPTTNAQGEATQISNDGVYVIGKDIPGGTWHTSGGQQCYEATLSSTNTENIIDNNNFTGPDTVSLSGAKAFDINGGCTWTLEG